MKVTRRTGSLVIVLVIFAAIVLGTALAAIAIDKSEIPMLQQHAAEAAGDEYVHGSNIGRTPSGTNVDSASAFRTAVNNNQDINLTDSFTISSPNIRSMADYSATIYGNGYTITFDLPKISGTNNSTEDYSGSNYYYCGLLVGTLCGRIYDLNVELTGGSFKTGLHTSGGSKLNTFGLVGRLYTNGNNHGTIENVSVTLNSGVGIRLYSWANTVRTGLGLVAGLAEGGAIIRNVTVENNGKLESGYTTDKYSASDIVYNDNGNVELRSASNVVGYFDSWSQTSGTITLDNIIVKGNGQLNGREACNLGTSESGNAINVGTFYNHFVGTFNGAGDTSPGFIPFDGNSTARTIKTLIEYNRVDHTDCVAGYGRGYNASINEKLTLRNTDGEILFDPAAALDKSLVLIYRNSVQNNAGSIYIYNLIATNRTSKGGTATTQTYRGEAVDNDVIFTGMPVVGTWNNCDWGRTATYPGGDGVFTSRFKATKLDVNVSELTEYDHGYVPKGYTPSGTGLSSTELFDLFVNRNNSNHHNGVGEYYLEEDAVITGFTGRDFGGTLDGKGHTVYIVDAQTGLTGSKVGGLVGTLTGTIKNLRIVIASSVTISTTGANPNSFGLVAGAVNGGTFENVNVVVGNNVTVTAGASNSGKTAALGGLAGCTVSTSTSGCTVSNCTVEINGTLSANGSYVFLAGFIGRSYNVTSTLYDYDNIILKGSGQFAGVANASTEPKCVAAISVMCGSSGTTQLDLNGLIYNFTNETPVAGTYSCYGYFANNTYGTQMSQELSANNYIAYNNVYTFGCEMNEYWWDRDTNNPNSSSWNGNTYIHIPTTAAISGSVTGLDGSTVTPYFPISYKEDGTVNTDNLVLVAGNGTDSFTTPVAYNNGTYSFVSKAVAVKVGEESITYQVVTVAKSEVKTNTVSLEIAAVNDPVIATPSEDLVYSGQSGIDVTIGALQCGSSYELKLGKDYSITIAAVAGGTGSVVDNKPVNTGDYTLTVTLTKHIFADESTVKVLDFTVSPKVISFKAGKTSFPFADTEGTAITDLNLLAGTTYSLKVTDDRAYNLTVSKDSGTLTYVTDKTASRTNYLAVGTYTVKLSPASGNYTFGSNNTFTFKVTENESANTWITEYARDGWTYYNTASEETTPLAKFGDTPEITYSRVSTPDESITFDPNADFAFNTPVGTYRATVKVDGDGTNYGDLIETYEFTVSPLDVTVELSAAETVYDGQAYEASNILITLTATVNGTETKYTSAENSSDVSALLGSYGWQYSKEGDSAKSDGLPTDAGTYTIYFGVNEGNVEITNGESGIVSGNLTIRPAEVTFSAAIASDAKLVYGTVPTDFNSLVNVTASGGINLSDEAWSYLVTPSVASGEYAADTDAGKTVFLTVQVTVTDPNHTAVQPAKLELTVQKKPVAVTANDVNEIYGDTFLPDGDANGYFGKYFTVDGAPITDLNKENSVVTITVSGFNQTADILNAGDYTVSVTVLGNHYIESVNDEKVSDNSAVINYNVAPKELSFTTAENLSFLFADTTRTAITDQNLTAGNTYSVNVTGFVEADPPEAKAYTLTVSKVSGTLTYVQDNTDSHNKYLAVGTYIVRLSPVSKNYTFGSNNTNTFTFNVTKNEFANTWTSQDEIDDYPFGFEGKPVTGTAKFGTATITYYLGDVKGQADKGDAIEFSFGPREEDADTYTAVVSVAGNDNYDGISYEYTFAVEKHGLNITDLKISGTGVSGSAADGFTVTYAPDMGLSATVKVGSAEGYAGNYSELLGDPNTRTYMFEHSAQNSDEWIDGLPKNAGKYTVRFKGMELDAKYDINNFAFVYEGNETELTTKLTINKATVSASAELKGDIVYGMTVDEIKELVSVSEGVSMKDVAVTYVNESGESVGYSETTQSGTKLTITVTVEAEDDNYTVDSDTVKLEKTVQKAKLTVTAEGGSAHSATFVPGDFKAFDQVEAKWGENTVEASKYLFIELTGYSGEVAGDPKTNFGNREIGIYTFTVKLKDDAVKNNFLMVDAAGAEYEGELTFTYTLATEKVTLTVKLEGWTYGDPPNNPTFTVKDADGNSIGMQTIGQYISVKYEGINGTVYDSATAPTEAGDYKITAAITEHHDYVAEKEATKEFTIGKRPIALVLSSDSASEYYDRRVAITDFTSEFGEYFSVAEGYSYADGHALKDVFTLTASSDSVVVTEIKNAGSYKITAKLINDNYVWATGATSPEFTYTIEKAIVTIQMAYKEANIYDGEPVDAPVLSFLELPNGEKYGTKDQFTDVEALIKDDEELMAILRAITVKYGIGETPIDAGEYTFTAVYPGNDNYADADYQGPFTIGKADIGEFSIEVSSLPYTGEHLAGQTPVMTGGNPQLEGEELSETVSYFVWNGTEYESVETATNVGQYKIVRTSPESNNYHEATAECEFTISPATVTINDYTASYDFGFIAAELKDEYPYVIALTASVSADSADEITYSTELIGDHGSEQGYLNVGSYTLKIVLTNGNYAFTEGAGEIAIEIVPSENKFVSVTKRDRWIYGNKPADINVSVAYGSANIVTYDSEGNVVELSAATYAGSYYDVVTVPASEFGNYAAIEYAGDTSFVIGKATFKWSWEFLPDNIVYGDSLDGAFVINEPEVTGGIESDFVYFVYNTNAVYSVGGEVYSYDPQTDAGTVVTISAQCVWSDETPEGIKTSYVIDPDEFGAIAFNMEVQKKPIAVTAVSLSDIYGSAFDPTGDANEYFGGAFLYNGAPITNLTAQNSVVIIEISGSGLADDRLNAGNYTVTVSVGGNHYIESAEDGTLENGCVSVGYTVMPKTLNISDGIKSLSYEFGMLSPEDLNASDAILNFIGGANGLFDGLAFGDSLTAGDFTLSAAQDYSAFVSEGYMIVSAEPYIVNVALSATSGNYIAPETGLDDIGIYVVKAANSIGRYSVSGWTYLDERAEYISSDLPNADFGTVEYAFFAPDGSEMTMDKFNSETPAGTYSFRFSVQGTDNYDSAVLTGEFVVDKLIVVAELTATDVTYDGAVYDGISYTLSFDVSDYIGTVGYEYSENGSAFRKGLPTDAGNYSVRIGEYSDSENIELCAETVDFQINPAPMHFTVTGVDGASIEYGTAVADIDVNALIDSVIPDSYVGGFEFTVSLITANGIAYRPGLYAGTTLYATVDITLDSNNYYPVVDTAIEMLPKVNITKVSHDMAFEISDEIITDGSSAAVIEGSANTVIDAISYFMAINDIQYYEYHITVDGEEYSRDFNWAPGTHTVEVRLSGNHEGSTQFTVVIEEDPDAVDRAPFTPKTVVGEVLESINFTWASAVSIAFGVAVAVLIILFFGLRRAKRK